MIWGYQDWKYRQGIVLAHSAGAEIGYEIPVNVTMSGLDNHPNSDFSDVRFTAADGITPIKYYLSSSVSGVSANFIVQTTDDISTQDVTIYIYYGNVDATSLSTTAAYSFKDSGLSDNSSLYTRKRLGSVGSTLYWEPTNQGYGEHIASGFALDFIQFNGLTGNNYEVKFDWMMFPHNGFGVGVGMRYVDSNPNSGLFVASIGTDAYANTGLVRVGPTNLTSNQFTSLGTAGHGAYSAGNWYTFMARCWGNTPTNLYYIDHGGNTLSLTNSNFSTGGFGIYMYQQDQDLQVLFRNVIVRHYTSPEPSVSSFLTEERNPAIPLGRWHVGQIEDLVRSNLGLIET